MGADFTPTFKNYSGQGAFRYWVQKALPLVYDDSLSYYELLNKMVVYLNNVISDVGNMGDNVEALKNSYIELQNYVNDYFDNLDVQEEINNKLDDMAESGEFNELFDSVVLESTQAWMNENILPLVPTAAVVVDKTLTIEGAAADSETVGDKFKISVTAKGLTLPEDPSENLDLNTVYDTGLYRIYSANNNRLTHKPETSATYGRLIVYGSTNPTSYYAGTVQVFHGNNGDFFWRVALSTEGNWSAWQKVSTVTVDSSLSVAGSAADSKTVGDRAMITRNLESGTDLNTVTIQGIYHVSTAIYNSLVNYPSTTYGKLAVFGSSVFKLNTVQVLVDHENDIYWRIATNNNDTPEWTDWISIHVASLYRNRALEVNTDLNNLKSAGVYRAYSGNIDSLVNYPSTATGRIVVLGQGSDANLVQVIFDLNDVIWWRCNATNAADGWTEWKSTESNIVYNDFNITLVPGNLHTTTTHAWVGEPETMLSLGNTQKSVVTVGRYNVGKAKDFTITWSPKNSDVESETTVYKDILYLFQFDASGNYITRTTSSPTTVDASGHATYHVTLNANTAQFTIKIYNGSGNPGLPNTDVKITIDGSVFYQEKFPVLNGTYSNSRWRRFVYYVGDYQDSNSVVTKNYNTGMIMQASNYSANGKPTPVIIFVHGSTVYMKPDGVQEADYEQYYRFLADCGYNLIDCYGFTARYWPQLSEANPDGYSNPWVMPTTCNAYLSLIDYVKKNFNVDENNIFIACKSLGGHMAAWLAYHIKAKAAGLLAPALRQAFGYNGAIFREVMVEDMGLKGTIASGTGWSWATEADSLSDFVNNYYSNTGSGWRASNTVGSEKRIAFYQANEQEIMGCSEDFDGVSNVKAKKQLEWTAYIPLRNADNSETYGDGMRSFSKVGYAPMKIWAASDDSAISYSSCDAFVQELRNGGCVGVMRTMPDNTGGHHSVDSDPSALQQTDVTTPLGYTYETVPLAYYELWQFFEKYRTA